MSDTRADASNQPHRIRLRGPWTRESIVKPVLDVDGPPADPCRSIRFRRHFSCPTGLDRSSRVVLVVHPDHTPAHVKLNQHDLGVIHDQGESGRFDITTLLEPRNQLQIDMPAPSAASPSSPSTGSFAGDAHLEIDRPH